jgi:hypothetical protein
MSSNRHSTRREERKAAVELPTVPDLSVRTTMPRKTNRSAARIVASGDAFWDKRKVAKKARRRALEIQAARVAQPRPHSLTRRQKQWVSNHLAGWSWDGATGALQAPPRVTQEQLDELVDVTCLPYVQRAVVRVQGLCQEQVRYIAERAPRTARFVLVDRQGCSQQTVRASRLG